MAADIGTGGSVVAVGSCGCGGGVGVGGLILFRRPDAGEELVHVHGAEVLAALAEGVLEFIESEGVDGGLSSERREGVNVVLVLLVGVAFGGHHLCDAEDRRSTAIKCDIAAALGVQGSRKVLAIIQSLCHWSAVKIRRHYFRYIREGNDVTSAD